MSTLTKLFVVLLVTCSLLLSAAVVVFVNRVEDYASAATLAQQKMRLETERATKAEADAKAATDLAAEQIRADNARQQEMDKQIQALNTQIETLHAESAKKDSLLTGSGVEKSQLTEALKASQEQSKNLEENVKSNSSKLNELLKKNSDLAIALEKGLAENQAVVKQLRWREEENTQLRAENTKLQGQVAKGQAAGGEAVVPSAVGVSSDVAINGIVRQVIQINNLPYATISVGSADNVSKGMKFNAVNRQSGEFLGILTIDQVQPNEAIGRLEGPRIKDIKAGTEVKTQL